MTLLLGSNTGAVLDFGMAITDSSIFGPLKNYPFKKKEPIQFHVRPFQKIMSLFLVYRLFPLFTNKKRNQTMCILRA